MPWEAEFWQNLWQSLQAQFADWLPGLLAAILILVAGWFIARLAQALVVGLLRRLGLDRLTERSGASAALARMNLAPSLSLLLGRFVYWIILLIFILAALEALGLASVSLVLGELVGFLPGLFAAILILVLGGLLARIVGDAVGAMAIGAGFTTGPILGQLARVAIFVVVVIIAVEQVGLQTGFLTTLITVIVAAFFLALGVAFGLGNRGLARNIMAGFHAKENFDIGMKLDLGEVRGELLSIGAAKANLKTGQGIVSVPNELLLLSNVVILNEEPAGGGEE